MPRKLVCVFGSNFYHDHAESRLLVSQMVRNQSEQMVHLVQIEIPITEKPASSNSAGISLKRMMRRKPVSLKESSSLPYTKPVSDAYGALSKCYQSGDKITYVAPLSD
ncbi:unnamed protein product [Rhizoctonia solani]|uniref:Uncharacterized protein n=1 Tax=Rhizoctonia solani TaxID=456999 RepID=A0A8H3DNL1_9AGAM|nr:unnamed protein product [Rhizoctonia solani]